MKEQWLKIGRRKNIQPWWVQGKKTMYSYSTVGIIISEESIINSKYELSQPPHRRKY